VLVSSLSLSFSQSWVLVPGGEEGSRKARGVAIIIVMMNFIIYFFAVSCFVIPV